MKDQQFTKKYSKKLAKDIRSWLYETRPGLSKPKNRRFAKKYTRQLRKDMQRWLSETQWHIGSREWAGSTMNRVLLPALIGAYVKAADQVLEEIYGPVREIDPERFEYAGDGGGAKH